MDMGQSVPDIGWRCAICFTYAQVLVQDTTFCVEHARKYNFGYGDSLEDLVKEFNKKK